MASNSGSDNCKNEIAPKTIEEIIEHVSSIKIHLSKVSSKLCF